MKKYSGLILILFFLILHLFVINDYGFTWDFHFHFFGGGKLLGIEPESLEPRTLPFVEPDPRRAWTLPYGPLMSVPPVASYLLLKNILPADVSYHLPIVLWGVAGIGILYIFMRQAFSFRISLIASLFLALTPRYFGDLHNNMKDIPSSVIFAANIWLLWRLVRFKRPIDLLWAIIAFAVAFSVKINSIFIPIIFACWLLFIGNWKLGIGYFILAPLAALLLWSVFWTDPVGQLRHAFLTFGIGTNNIEVLLNGNWYCSGSSVPWYYPFWYLTITTPIPVLVFFLIGLIRLIRPIRPIGILLILWLFLPLTRYFIPTIGVIDGIRHFEEVIFPIAAIAAIGADRLFSFARPGLAKLISLITLISLIAPIMYYHPYQIAYFNELVGGAKGATGKYDLDYWGTSQKAAVEWVNKTAPKNATVHIIMAAAVAGQYLRPDLLENLNRKNYEDSDFVILLNRQSFLYRFYYAYRFLLTHRPAHTIKVAGAPLTWIYDNLPAQAGRTSNVIPKQKPFWQGEDPCIRKYWQ